MALLEECDPEAEVRIMDQEGWPFECAIRGVVTRDMLVSDECDCGRRIGEPHDEECLAFGEDEGVYEDGLAGERRVHRRGTAGALWQQEGVGAGLRGTGPPP